MENKCSECALRKTARCPYVEDGIPTNLMFGCYRFIKLPVLNQPKNTKPTSCMHCRYLFRKAKAELADKSFIMCGAIPSLTRKILPIPSCPYFKVLRKNQARKRQLARQTTHDKKAPYRKRVF